MKILATLIVGVACLGVVLCDNQSAITLPEDEPIVEQGSEEKRRIDTPEVVLQLKYDRGELNRIYLAQFRKPKGLPTPSVNSRTDLCTDLCHAGLGGDVCGETCSRMIPVGLKSALTDANVTHIAYGQPRVSVCPTLCESNLGQPLCQCQQNQAGSQAVDWVAVCDAFCADGYCLNGCPPCGQTSPPHAMALSAYRALNTVEGWSAWCDVQCRQGHGGAACNCDRTPFQ